MRNLELGMNKSRQFLTPHSSFLIRSVLYLGFPGRTLPGDSFSGAFLFASFGLFATVAALLLGNEAATFGIDAEGFLRAAAGGLEERLSAVWAEILRRHLPAHEAALLSALAGIVGIALLAGALENPAAALGALAGHLNDKRLCERAFRITRAGKKTTESAGLDDHLASADVTRFVG